MIREGGVGSFFSNFTALKYFEESAVQSLLRFFSLLSVIRVFGSGWVRLQVGFGLLDSREEKVSVGKGIPVVLGPGVHPTWKQ